MQKSLLNLKKKQKETLCKYLTSEKLKLGNHKDIDKATIRLNDKIAVYKKKIDMHEKRVEYTKSNTNFEINRRKFYKSLKGENITENDIQEKDIADFWATMWKVNKQELNNDDLKDLLPKHIQDMEPLDIFPSYDEFKNII